MKTITTLHYYLADSERMKLEEALLDLIDDNEEEILKLDDYMLRRLYMKRLNDQNLLQRNEPDPTI